MPIATTAWVLASAFVLFRCFVCGWGGVRQTSERRRGDTPQTNELTRQPFFVVFFSCFCFWESWPPDGTTREGDLVSLKKTASSSHRTVDHERHQQEKRAKARTQQHTEKKKKTWTRDAHADTCSIRNNIWGVMYMHCHETYTCASRRRTEDN